MSCIRHVVHRPCLTSICVGRSARPEHPFQFLAQYNDATAEAAGRDLAPPHTLVRSGAGDADEAGDLSDGERPPHDEMAGFYEVRIQGGGMNHRLFCILERDAADLGGSSIVVIDGLSKPKRSAADPKDYRRARAMRVEFLRRRSVLE